MGEHVARLESPAGPVESAARRLTAGIRHASLAPPRLATKGTTTPPRNGRRAFCAAAPEMGALIRRRLFSQFPDRRRGGPSIQECSSAVAFCRQQWWARVT
ncbi:hypothetical protein MTO96_008488 [Rhipicephalus appendiculatus]